MIKTLRNLAGASLALAMMLWGGSALAQSATSPRCLASVAAKSYAEGQYAPCSVDLTGSLRTTGGGDASAANQTVVQANPGSDATKAIAVQGVTGAKSIKMSIDQSTPGTTNGVQATNAGTFATQIQATNGDAITDTGNALDVNVKTGAGVAQGSTTSGQTGALVQGAAKAAPSAPGEGTTVPLSLDLNNNLRTTNPAIGQNNVAGATAPAYGVATLCTAETSYVLPANGNVGPVPCAAPSDAATGSAVPPNAKYSGVQASGVLKGITGCDLHAFYDASDNGKKTVVAGVSAKKIYICGYILATGGTATNLSLTSGTGTDCVTTSTAITPAYQLVANDRIGANAPFWNGLVTLATADNLCVNASAANAHQVEIWYTIQ